VLSAFICVHLRSSAANSGFDGSRWAGGKDIWPQMNADEQMNAYESS
jgi:hypothetical protein